MKVGFIITGLPKGRAQMTLLKLLERLDPCFVPHVISLTTAGDAGPRISVLGVPVESLRLDSLASTPLAFLSLTRRLRKLCPQVVHTRLYHADLIGGLAASGARSPHRLDDSAQQCRSRQKQTFDNDGARHCVNGPKRCSVRSG